MTAGAVEVFSLWFAKSHRNGHIHQTRIFVLPQLQSVRKAGDLREVRRDPFLFDHGHYGGQGRSLPLRTLCYVCDGSVTLGQKETREN